MTPAEQVRLPVASRSLPVVTKLWLAAEILFSYGEVRWAMHGNELPQAVQRLRQPVRGWLRTALPDGAGEGRRLGRAVTRTLQLLPANTMCLMQSLVLLRMLVRRGVPTSLVIAVLPTGGLDLTAHAWIEHTGQPLLNPGGDDFQRLATL
jgi:hypothetical protein